MTTTALPDNTREFLGIGNNAGDPNFGTRDPSFGRREDAAPFPMPGNPQNVDLDSFDDRTRKERAATFRAAGQELFRADISKLDNAGAWGLYHAVTESMFGLTDEDGSVAFGKRAAKDPRQNIEMLRRFVKGEYTLIEDPEYTKWREMDDEAKFKYALENEGLRTKLGSNMKGERGASFWEIIARSGTSSAPGMQLPEEESKDIYRRMNYETLTDEEKAKYRADVVADYDEKLSRRQTLATFLQFSQGLSDRASWMLAKSFNDGVPDSNIETLPEDERDRVYSAFSLMRGDQKNGTLLFVPTDFTDDTRMNRIQLGLYGLQQSVLGLATDTWGMARDSAMWAYAKTALSESERKEFFDWWNAQGRMEQAMRQGLPEAESFFGEAFQGVAENVHWFIPYSMIGKGGKMVNAARGLKGEQGLLKGLKATLTPMRLGGSLKEEKAALEAGKAAMEAGAAATKAAYTLDINGVKKLGDYGKALLARQMAAVDRYTQMLKSVDNDLKAAKWWKDAAGTGMWAMGEAQAFSAFASEYIANADAAGISREESVLTAAAIGLINAKIEQLYVPGLESSLSPAQIKSLTFAAMAQAIRSDGAAGFRKWLANRIGYGVREGVKVAATEGLVEEPLQQMAIEHGKAFDKLCQELNESGNATAANEAKALWNSIVATLPQDYATFIDTAADMVASSAGFGVMTIGNMTRRQHFQNVMMRHANRRAGSTSTMGTAQTMQDLMRATDYDAGVVDVIQRAVNVRSAIEKQWQGEGGEAQKNPHRFEEAITAARKAFRNSQSGDTVGEVAKAAGVDIKTAEVLTQYLQTEAEAAAFSPTVRAWTSLNMSLADIDEQTIKTVLPGYVDGSFAADPEKGIYSGRVKLADGTERTIAYKVGDLSEELMKQVEAMAKPNSAYGKSWDARIDENNAQGLVDGAIAADMTRKWADMSDQERYMAAVRAQAGVNGFSSGTSGVFELTDAKGEKVQVNADDVIYLASGRIADIGYGPAATQGTARHETFHSVWRFIRATLDDADVQQLAKTLGIDVSKDGWEVELDEKMAHQMERYASGHHVAHAISSRFDKMIDGWAGKLVNFFAKIGQRDEVTDPATGKAYQLKDIYDKILRGEFGTGALGVELAKIPAQPTGEAATTKSAMPVEVTDADRAEQEEAAQQEAAKEEPPAPATPAATVASVPVATLENPADASTPNQQYYRVGLPNSNVKLVGRLEVRDAETGLVTSTDEGYHDRGNQNRDDKSEESRALVEKIGANPDPLQVGTVQPIANNGIVWALPNGDVIIGNHRVNGVRLGYEKGTTAELEKFVREDATKRGIEIGENVKKPITVFVLERIETPEGTLDGANFDEQVHEVVRLANESQNRGFNVREQAANDAKIIVDNNLLPQMAFRADGRIDETKSGDAIGKFRQETGAQGMIAEDGSLTEEGQTRIQNAALAALLGRGENAALLQKIMANAGRLDMQNELRALMKMTPELMSLAEAKPAYDLRGPLAEALQLFTEWRDKDETARVEKGKTRHDWRETAKDGHRVRGISWEQFMSQGDMFRKPSDEAKILGDLFARAEEERSFDREDVESAVGKKRAIDLVAGYLADYIENAKAVNTETEDIFGGVPASRADVMAAQRINPAGGVRFSVDPAKVHPATKAEYDMALSTWGEMKIDSGNVEKAGWIFPDGRVLQPRVRKTPYGTFVHHDSLFAFLERPDRENDVERFEYGYADALAGGALRLNLGNGGIEVMRLPTASQLDTLYDALDAGYALMEDEGEDVLRVDVDREDGAVAFTAQYRRGTSARRIMDDLREWFDNKKIPAAAADNARFSVAAGTKPATQEEIGRVVEHFGTTRNYREAGYILPDGRMLDLSGRKEGARGGNRTLDHREVWDVLSDRAEGGDAMMDFMASGAIRLTPEAAGINMVAKPNESQEEAIASYIEKFDGEVNVDFMAKNGDFGVSASYAEGTSPERVLNEIRRYYDEGVEPRGTGEQADGSFRYSISGIYTGSAADYAKPSLKKIGTGEGSQVYGWGLYGSNVRGVAEGYAKSAKHLVDRLMVDGKKADPYSSTKWYSDIQNRIFRVGSVEETRKRIAAHQPIWEGDKNLSASDWDKLLSTFDKHSWELKEGNEYLYEQTWFTNREPGDENHLLKWYSPVSEEQRQWIQSALQKENLATPEAWGAPRADGAFYNYTGPTISFSDGYSLYNSLTRLLGSPRAASEFLARAGVDGVKYPVDSYGKLAKNGDEAGWDYVSFRDDNIRVDHKWTDGQLRYSVVQDPETIAQLESEPKIRTYRAMQLVDGKLYPPMAGKVDGKWQEPAELGKWIRADERPNLVRGGKFTLNKGNGSSIAAAYNPYWHTSRSPLNDQFSTAYKRPNLVTVEVEVPSSELTSGYRAEGAKDAVGEMSWHSGPVSSKLAKFGNPRSVILSRWCKPIRIVPDAEVADRIKGMLDGTDISIPANVVTPSLRAELESRNVPVRETADLRYSVVTPAEDAAYMDAVKRGDMETAKRMIREIAGRKIPSLLKDEDGLPLEMYHGSDKGRNVFRAFNNAYGVKGVNFIDSYGRALEYAQEKWATEENVEKFAKEFPQDYKELSAEIGANSYSEFADKMRELDEDTRIGIMGDDVVTSAFLDVPDFIDVESIGGARIAVAQPDQIYSSEVTYDDAGNVIPLSQRFNNESRDIRYSVAMTRVGDWYYMTGKAAEQAAPHLGTSIVMRNGTPTTAFPAYMVDTMLAKLIRNGLSATLRNRMSDGTYRERKVEPGVPTGRERFSFAIGEVGATNLDDALFVAGDMAVAEQMLGGRDWAKIKKDERLKIKLATGWEKGADGLWRYETGDFPEINLERLKKPNPEYKEGGAEENPSPDDKKHEPAKYLPVKLADMFAKKQWKQIPLFVAYPWLKNVTIQYGATNLGGANGAFDDSDGKYLISISEEKRPDAEGLRTTLIHEIQHAIQRIEGFAQGGNSKLMRREFLKKFTDAQDEARAWHNRFYKLVNQYGVMVALGYLNYPKKHPRHIEAAQQIESDPAWAQLEEDRKEFRKKWGHDPKFFLDSDWGAWAKATRAGFRDYRKLAGEVEARNASRRTEADRGKLLEETEDEPRRSQIVRFSIAAKLDDERRRIEARGGKLLLAFHGTQEGGFTVFDQAKNNAGMPGFYFAKDRDTAMTYSSSVRYNGDDEGDIDGVFEGHNALYNDKGVYNVALRMERPLEIDAQGRKWDSIPYEGENRMTREVVEDAFAKGYDGVIIHNVLDNGGGGMSGYLDPSDVYVVKESNQIKSVDEVTYADDDSIIPEESRFDWTNPDIRYSVSKDLRDAMRRREIMQGIPVEGAVQPWPKNFPKVILQTTLGNIKQKWPELLERAKAGRDGAALELVRNILGEARIKGKSNPKWEKLRKLANAHPRALILPVRAQEMTGRNKIPSAYAAMIRALTGLRLAGSIVQTVRANHTGANAVDRMTRRAMFDGPVMRGREYILVDDHVTQGGTLNELRKFIQARGGKVVAITTLTASQFSDTISISNEAVRTLYAKFGNDLDEKLQEAGIANGVAELTQSQARELLKLRPDTLRGRLAEARVQRQRELDGRGAQEARLSNDVSGYTDLIPGLNVYFKPDGTPTETGTRWAKARQFQRPISRELNSIIDEALDARDLSREETAAELDRLVAAAEATDEIKNGVLPNFRKDSAKDDPAVFPIGEDGKPHPTPERHDIHRQIYALLMSDTISAANNEALATNEDGTAKEAAIIERANEGRPDLPPIPLQNPTYETQKEFRVDIVIGPPAAGKSSVFVNALSVFYRSRVLDCDTIKQMLPGFNNGNGASYVHEESSALNKEMIRDVQQRSKDDPRRGENIVLPIVGEDTEGLRKKIAAWHAVGYTVYLHNNRVPIVHAFGRALVRTLSSGRWINPEVIKRCQDNPTRAYNTLKGEVDYYDQFNNDVSYGEKPLWEDGNYSEPAYGGSRRRAGEDRLERSADSRGVDGRPGRDIKRPASRAGQYVLPGFERFSTEAPRFNYPNPLNALSDDELIAAAVATRMALGGSEKFSDRAIKVNTVQKLMRRLHPDWDDTDIGRETNRIISDARKLGKKIREDFDKGVSESRILEHLPETAREQFGREMRQEARKGQRLGVFAQRVKGEIDERQARMVEDAVRVQTGLDAGNIENAYGINLSETIMHLAENPLTEKPLPAGGATVAGVGDETAAEGSDGDSSGVTVEIDSKVKAAVEDILAASRTAAEADDRNRRDRRAAAGRAAERKAEAGEEEGAEGSGEGDLPLGDGDFLVNAVKKEGVDLENPRHLARFVAELARRQWIKEHGLGQDAEVWRDLVAVQFLRKTAQSVYAKLCRDLTYSRGRETAMQHIAKFDAAPTVAGLMSEMEFVGALINARRIRDTQQQKCEKLDLFLREKFGAQGRFKPDKEEGQRKVSAEAELRARYMRHAMWLTPDAAAKEARQLQETLDSLSVDFKDAGRDVDQSREFVETIRKLNVLREFGALRYKPLGEIDAAAQWWEDFERGSSDDIVREMSDRDIRTKKAAHLLAVAFADPKRTTVHEGGSIADRLSRFITGHMGFVSLLQDCMRFAPDADTAAVKDILDYIVREIQKSGDGTEAEKRRHNEAFFGAVQSIYGKDFNTVMKEMSAPDERFAEFMGVVGGKRVTPTKGRALQLLVSLLQEGRRIEVEDEDNPGKTKIVWEGGYHDNIVKHKRQGQAQKIMRLLTAADMNMLKWLGQWYEQNRSDLSEVCHSLFGIGVYAELPNYFPVKMLLEKQGLEKGEGVSWTIFPKALTPRVKNERDFDTSADVFSMWASRMEEAAQWKHHAQLGLEMRGIFGRGELQASVIANHGKDVNALMQGFITDILAGHGAYDRSPAGVQYFSDQIRGWTALCALGGNVGVMFKQTTSIPAFGFEIGLVNTAKYMVGAFTPEGLAAMRRIWDSEQRQTRWKVGSSEVVRNALNQDGAGVLKRMFQASMITNKLGDVVPALVVGQGIYRDCLERGMSEDDAMAETWSIIERTQQSGRMENLTSIQRRNKLGRILFQFLSTQQQYLQYEVRAIREVVARPDSVKRWGSLGRAVLLNHFILSSAYFWVGELYKACLGQEPPEDELKDWLITCLLGPYGSLMVAGFMCKATLERAIKGYSIRGGSSMLPMESWMKTQINDGARLMEALFDSEGDTWDEVLDAVGRWMSDVNSTVRDLRKLYRYRIKEEPQNRR